MEHRVLALEVLRMIIFGEFDGNVLFLADVHADHLFFKTGNERFAAEFEVLFFGGAAVELYAVHAAAVIDNDGVAVFRRPAFHRHQAGISLLQAGERGFHVLVFNIILNFFKLYTLVFAQFDFGFDGYDGHEGNALVAHVLHVQRRLRHRLDGGFFP